MESFGSSQFSFHSLLTFYSYLPFISVSSIFIVKLNFTLLNQNISFETQAIPYENTIHSTQ